MRYSFLFALCALGVLFNAPVVRAESLTVHTDDIMTHTALLPEPVASGNVFKLAATWWLPDWQGSQGSRGSTDDGGGDIDGNCEKNYGMHTPSNIDDRYTCSKYNYNVTSSLKCHVNCKCKPEYKYNSSNCNGNYTTSGRSCNGNYSGCVCKSEFSQNSSNCNGEYRPAGESCGGNYNRCEMRPECAISSMSCTYGCAGYNSCDRCTSCKSNPDCDVSDKYCPYDCASYNSCSKCTSCNPNPACSVTPLTCEHGCASTNSCGICISCAGNPDCNVADKSCDCGCDSKNSCGKCTSCKSCPPADPCAGVSCGANAYCSGGSCYCNSGYTGNANSGCTKIETCNLPNCSSSVSSKPSNSSYTTKTCTDCSGTHTINTGWSCNSGYHRCGNGCIPSSQCCTGWDCSTGCCSGGRCVSCPTCYVISSDCTRGYGSSYYYVVDTCIDFDTGSSCGGSWGNTIENEFSTLYECQSSISSYKSNICKN